MRCDIVAGLEGEEVRIPDWVADNASFLRWATSEDAPEKGKYGFFRDHLWVDATMETFFHNQIKAIIARQVGLWVEEQHLGDYLADGMLMSSPEHEFSSQPDGMFVAKESWAAGRVRLQEDDKSVVLLGAPDMVLEVVSRSSTLKDQKTKKQLYYAAAVREYWMVDSRLAGPDLVIYRPGQRAYAAVRAQKGWVESTVLGAEFRLVVKPGSGQRRAVKLERR